jgi:putative transposase
MRSTTDPTACWTSSTGDEVQQVLVITAGDKITVADLEGEILIEHTRPAPGMTYVGNGRPRGPRQDP